MKKIFLLIILISANNLLMAQANTLPDHTNIYLVRHAEKELGKDPQLTEAGKKRAGDLMRLLKDKKISRIYVTNYRRSWMTADSLRLQLGIDTIVYTPDTTGIGLLTKLKENNDFGKTILVIGHSNTIPHLVKVLGVDDYITNDIPDEEFDNLYLVQCRKNKVYLEHKKYGEVSK